MSQIELNSRETGRQAKARESQLDEPLELSTQTVVKVTSA
jgi:hypothetical protein